MKILAIVNGGDDEGSTKYRLMMYRDFLAENGVEIETVRKRDIDESTVKRASEVDLVFNQKCLFKKSLALKIMKAAKRSCFDIDDAVWTRPDKPYGLITGKRVKNRLHCWFKHADFVMASNGFLADYARTQGANVKLMPMSLRLDEWFPIEKIEDDVIRIGWAGSPGNIPYLESLDKVFKRLKEDYQDKIEICVYSGRKPQLSVPFEWQDYAPGTESGFVQKLDIGLLPLKDDEYLKGKSPIKTIQYLSCAVPVVAYVSGGTREILSEERAFSVQTEDEWVLSIKKLIDDFELRQKMGKNGRDFVLETHAYERCKYKLLNLLKGD